MDEIGNEDDINIHRQRAQEWGRGRDADRPMHIPFRGWLDAGMRVGKQIATDRIDIAAAAVAFYSILGIFPGLAALMSLYGLFADPATVTGHMQSLAGVIPGSTIDLIRDQLQNIATNRADSLGLTFLFTLLISLWTANNAMKCLFETMNMAYRERESRNFFSLTGITLLCTFGVVLLMIFSLGVIIVVPAFLRLVNLSFGFQLLTALVPVVVLFLVFATALSVIYRYGPDRERAQWRWVTVGSLLASFLWILASAAFAFYLGNIADYSATYGSLGAVFGMLTWLYLSAFVVLLGAEINAEIEHQTACDSTTGEAQPLGRRGARKADTVGAAR